VCELSNKKSRGVKGFAVFHRRPNGPNIETRRADSGVRYRTPIFLYLKVSRYAFSALTLLVGRQEGHPACKKLSDGLLAWLSVWSEVQTCPADATATHCLLLQ